VASREAEPYVVAFYGNLQEGKPRAEALRLARKDSTYRAPKNLPYPAHIKNLLNKFDKL